MSPDDEPAENGDTGTDDRQQGTADATGGQPRDPKTGHFLPKDADPAEYPDDEAESEDADESVSEDTSDEADVEYRARSETGDGTSPQTGRSIWPSIPGQIGGSNVFVIPLAQSPSSHGAGERTFPPSLLPALAGQTLQRRSQHRQPQFQTRRESEATRTGPDTVGRPSAPDVAGTAGEIPVHSHNRPFERAESPDSEHAGQQPPPKQSGQRTTGRNPHSDY